MALEYDANWLQPLTSATLCGVSEKMCQRCGVAPTRSKHHNSKHCQRCHKDKERFRSTTRRQDPEYNAKQRKLKVRWKAENRDHYLAKHREYAATRYERKAEEIKAGVRAYRVEHLEQVRAKEREYKRANSSVRNAQNLKAHYKAKYGLTPEDIHKMLQAQDFRCAICGVHNDKSGGVANKLHVDHDHKTGQVRQLLCFLCNTQVGTVEKLAASGLLFEFLEYIHKHRGVEDAS